MLFIKNLLPNSIFTQEFLSLSKENNATFDIDDAIYGDGEDDHK